jgi:hypothetical protein
LQEIFTFPVELNLCHRQCAAYHLLTNNVTLNSTSGLVELYTTLTQEQLGRLAVPQLTGFLPLDDERTCRKEICRRRYVSKQVAVEYGQPSRRDCQTAKEIFHQASHVHGR